MTSPRAERLLFVVNRSSKSRDAEKNVFAGLVYFINFMNSKAKGSREKFALKTISFEARISIKTSRKETSNSIYKYAGERLRFPSQIHQQRPMSHRWKVSSGWRFSARAFITSQFDFPPHPQHRSPAKTVTIRTIQQRLQTFYDR